MHPGLNITPLNRATSWYFLVAFTKFQKATISFIMSVCLSICLHGRTWLPLDGFSWNLIQEHF